MDGYMVQGISTVRQEGAVPPRVEASNLKASLVIAQETERSQEKRGEPAERSPFGPQEYPLVSLETLQRKIFESLGINPPPSQVEVYIDQQAQTPEKTAEFVVTGIGKLFDRYLKGREGEDRDTVISNFFGAAREGVEKGAEEATKVLEQLGFLGIDGVESGVEKTVSLIYEKLDKLEQQLRGEVSGENKEKEGSAATVEQPVKSGLEAALEEIKEKNEPSVQAKEQSDLRFASSL